jgi:hypothetical protein
MVKLNFEANPSAICVSAFNAVFKDIDIFNKDYIPPTDNLQHCTLCFVLINTISLSYMTIVSYIIFSCTVVFLLGSNWPYLALVKHMKNERNWNFTVTDIL